MTKPTNPTAAEAPAPSSSLGGHDVLIELQARIGDAHENHGRNHEKTAHARRVFYAALRAALATPKADSTEPKHAQASEAIERIPGSRYYRTVSAALRRSFNPAIRRSP